MIARNKNVDYENILNFNWLLCFYVGKFLRCILSDGGK
jgi:hypothetical protein